MADVGRLEDFTVVVALSQAAEQQFPPLPYGLLELGWEIPDPSKAAGSAEERDRAYELVYHELQEKIEELIEGLLGVQVEKDDE
jgi:protein-tyrosine-phosphatase